MQMEAVMRVDNCRIWLVGLLAGAMVSWAGCSSKTTAPAASAADSAAVVPGGDATASTDTTEPSVPGDVNWHQHIKPLFDQTCAGCHKTGGIAPFALDTYASVKTMAAAVKNAVTTGRMPPWMPAESCQTFQESRRMTAAEIATVAAWVDAGTPEGSASQAGKPPGKTGTELEWVDVELKLAKAYLPAKQSGSDDYHCFYVDPKLTDWRDLVGMQVLPDNKVMVHHVILWASDKAQAQGMEKSAGDGWTCYGGSGVPGQMLGGWVPGTIATRFPEGTAMRIQAGQVFVVQIHYSFASLGGNKVEPDQTALRFQFAKEPVMTQLKMLSHSDHKFSVPPGAKQHIAGATLEAFADIRLWGILPHMHQHGTSIKVTVDRGAAKECLIDIPKWDFNWQQLYLYDEAKELRLNKGEKLQLECVYDNPTDKPLTWGENTEDEMCLNYYLYSLSSVEVLHKCLTAKCGDAQKACLADTDCKKAYYCALACPNTSCAKACGDKTPQAGKTLFGVVVSCAAKDCLT
jgi:mono/diheme cytochrome c family protein